LLYGAPIQLLRQVLVSMMMANSNGMAVQVDLYSANSRRKFMHHKIKSSIRFEINRKLLESWRLDWTLQVANACRAITSFGVWTAGVGKEPTLSVACRHIPMRPLPGTIKMGRPGGRGWGYCIICDGSVDFLLTQQCVQASRFATSQVRVFCTRALTCFEHNAQVGAYYSVFSGGLQFLEESGETWAT
jgi:hypothetical protein